jgi:hypothetical protein
VVIPGRVSNAPLPDADHAVTDEALTQLRTQAVQEITADRGTDGIRDLARTVKYSFLLGVASAAANVDETDMLALLTSEDESVQLCGIGYASERYRREGMPWVDRTLTDHQGWNPNTRTALLLAASSDRPTWDRAEQQGVGLDWRRTRVFLGHGTTPEDIAYAITHLLAADQIPQAFEQVSMSAQKIPTPLLTQTLDRVLQALQDPQRPWGHLVSFNIVRILNVLDQRNDIDAAAIAHYEWAYLPLLRHERQLSLHEHLATGPDLFAQMIASVYRPAKEEAPIESTMEDVARARQAYDLLSSWRRIPGTQPDGNIDEHQLFGWVDNARAACETRSDMCDSHIGRVLAYAPKGTDGVWPHEAVRALIEHVNSAALGGGFRAGIFNTRGFFTRDPFAGGTQERDLATQYRGWAQKLAAVAPHRRRAL